MIKHEKKSFLKPFLLIGSLLLLTGASVSLVISCSSSITVNEGESKSDEVAESINNVSAIKPNIKGEFSDQFDGWDIIAIDVDSISELYALKLVEFSAGDEYRLQFTLKSGFMISSDSLGLLVNTMNDQIYYSEILIFTEAPESLTVEKINMLTVHDNAQVIGEFKGWNIEVVSTIKDNDANYSLINSLMNLDEYKLKFTLLDNFVLENALTSEFLFLDNGMYFTTENYVFINLAESIDELKLNSIYPSTNGEISETFMGWDIEVIQDNDTEDIILAVLAVSGVIN